MMPVVRISDATMRKLQPLAIPLTDNLDTLLSRLADAAHGGVPYSMPTMTFPAPSSQPVAVAPWDLKKHDDLTHTRLISARFGGVTLPKANWNHLAKYAHEIAFRQLGSFDALRVSTRARIKEGKYEQEGYVYLPGINISLQGMDSNMSWDNSVRLAHAIGVSVSADFEWRNNSKALKPGQKSSLLFTP